MEVSCCAEGEKCDEDGCFDDRTYWQDNTRSFNGSSTGGNSSTPEQLSPPSFWAPWLVLGYCGLFFLITMYIIRKQHCKKLKRCGNDNDDDSRNEGNEGNENLEELEITEHHNETTTGKNGNNSTNIYINDHDEEDEHGNNTTRAEKEKLLTGGDGKGNDNVAK